MPANIHCEDQTAVLFTPLQPECLAHCLAKWHTVLNTQREDTVQIYSGKVDQAGRIELPKSILEASGLAPESEVLIEATTSGVIIRRKQPLPPITERIAEMSLPVDDWQRMEEEIIDGRLE